MEEILPQPIEPTPPGSLPASSLMPDTLPDTPYHTHNGTDGSPRLNYNNLLNLPTSMTPTTHATSHQSGGSDAIKLDDLAAPDDNTDLNASTSKHGLLPKLSNVATEFLNGTGAFSTPAIGSKIYITTTPVTVSNTTTETDLVNFTLSGGTLGTNNAVAGQLKIDTVRTISGGPYTLTIRLYFGGTLYDELEYIFTYNSSSYLGGILHLHLAASGATNTQVTSTLLHLAYGNGTTLTQLYDFAASTPNKDSTADQTIRITAQWSNADANIGMRMLMAVFNKI